MENFYRVKKLCTTNFGDVLIVKRKGPEELDLDKEDELDEQVGL